MDTSESRQIHATVERVVESKQHSNSNGAAAAATRLDFSSIMRWAEDKPPPYEPDTRKLDKWLVEFVRREPHLRGVQAQAVSLVRNRGFSVTGGRNQVNRVVAMIHDADRKPGSPRGQGYRHYISRIADSFYGTNLGAISENGRDEAPRMVGGVATAGPLRAIWSADPTRFKLRSRDDKQYPLIEYPLAYYPAKGRKQYWRHLDYFRVVANPSTDEAMNGAGFCPVAMVRELAEILVAVYTYDKEQLGARAPKGLLLLQNVREEQWDTAMRSREAKLDGMERDFFGAVAVLAHTGVESIDAKLVALSSLPTGWNRREMIDLLMYLYALCYGYPPDEFWPVMGGQFGRDTESRLGIERASRKGDRDFFSAFQEALQAELPASILLEYDERDDRGRQVEAEVALTWAEVAKILYEAGQTGPEGPLLNRQQVLSFLVDHEVIPPEMSEAVEDAVATDTEVARLRLLQERLLDTSSQVHRAIRRFPKEPIVRYNWPSGRTITLWQRGEDATKPHSFPVAKRRAVLYRNDEEDFTITDEDVDNALATGARRLGGEFAELLNAPNYEEVE